MKKLLFFFSITCYTVLGQVSRYDTPQNEMKLRQSAKQEGIVLELDFHDVSGIPKLYLNVLDMVFYNWYGKPIGFLDKDKAFTINGKHVGYFDSEGLLIDLNGYVVGVLEGSTNLYLYSKPPKSSKETAPPKGTLYSDKLKPEVKMFKSPIQLSNLFDE